MNIWSNCYTQSKQYFLKREKRIKRHPAGKKERKKNAKNEKRKRKKNSKTDRGKLPDRTQIEATFSSHNLEE